MKKLFYYFIFIFLFSLTGCNSPTANNLKTVLVNGQTIKVEIADTPLKRFQGLSNRDSLPAGQGMLFVFDHYTLPSFVMREMRFPLDIIWIKDSHVLSCAENLPAPKAGETPITVSPPSEINYVLEVNAGWCDRYDIQAGNEVVISN